MQFLCRDLGQKGEAGKSERVQELQKGLSQGLKLGDIDSYPVHQEGSGDPRQGESRFPLQYTLEGLQELSDSSGDSFALQGIELDAPGGIKKAT